MRRFGILSLLLPLFAGCAESHGNRRTDAPMLTRTSELHKLKGKRVTLVGTARSVGPDGDRIDLRGGSVDLPAFRWPDGYDGKSATIIGTLREDRKLGDIEAVDHWSR